MNLLVVLLQYLLLVFGFDIGTGWCSVVECVRPSMGPWLEAFLLGWDSTHLIDTEPILVQHDFLAIYHGEEDVSLVKSSLIGPLHLWLNVDRLGLVLEDFRDTFVCLWGSSSLLIAYLLHLFWLDLNAWLLSYTLVTMENILFIITLYHCLFHLSVLDDEIGRVDILNWVFSHDLVPATLLVRHQFGDTHGRLPTSMILIAYLLTILADL